MTKKLRTAQVDIPPLGTAASYDVGTAAGEIALIGSGGTLPIDKVASGTPSGKKFVRDDSTLVEITGRLYSGTTAPPPSVPTKIGQVANAVQNAATLTLTLPVGTAVGDLLLLVSARYGNAVTDPSGFTLLTQQGNHKVHYKIATAADITAGSVSYGSTQWAGAALVVYRYVGSTPVAAFDPNYSSGTNLTTLGFDNVAVTGQKKVVRLVAASRSNSDPGPITVSGLSNVVSTTQNSFGSAVIAEETITNATTPTRTADTWHVDTFMTVTVVLNSADAASASDGDYYLNKTNGDLYGPMVGGSWGTTTGLATQAELDALAGTIYSGTDTPPAGTGATGDYYHSTNLKRLYGPKAADSAWGSRSVTPTFRAASTAAIGAAGNSLGCTAPTGLQVGDVMVAVVATHVGVTPTGPTGWTALVGSGTTHSVWWKIAVSGDIGATFTWSNGGTNAYMAIAIAAYSGVDGTGPVDVVTAFGATATTPTLTPTSGSAVVLDIWTNSGSGTAVIGSPAGTMQRASVLNSGNGWASINISDEVHDNTVTTARTATGGGGTWGSLQVALLTPLVSSYAELSDSIATQAELDVVASRVTTLEGKIPPPATVFTMSGPISAQVGVQRLYNDTGRTLTISAVRASLGTAGSTDTTVDINKDGTTIFTTQANRPNLAAAAVTVKSVAPDVTTWEDGSYLTVDVDAAGTSADTLTVTVVVS